MLNVPNWFSQDGLGEFGARGQFEKFLRPLAGRPNLYFIQVGVFCGEASEWLFENILTHPSSRLDDVDVWAPPDYFGVGGVDQEAIYDARVAPYAQKVNKFKMPSALYFTRVGDPLADFIYIDGDHNAIPVLEDAVAAWRRLKPGGILAFDDYSDLGLEHEHPHLAINAFLSVYGSELEVLSRALQVWVRKCPA